MIILVILSLLITLGIYLVRRDRNSNLGILMVVIFGFYIISHILLWFTASYGYESFISSRDAFELTLKTSRESGNQYETAAIVNEISKWNIRLAEAKYKNKFILLDKYVDDRVESTKPIK